MLATTLVVGKCSVLFVMMFFLWEAIVLVQKVTVWEKFSNVILFIILNSRLSIVDDCDGAVLLLSLSVESSSDIYVTAISVSFTILLHTVMGFVEVSSWFCLSCSSLNWANGIEIPKTDTNNCSWQEHNILSMSTGTKLSYLSFAFRTLTYFEGTPCMLDSIHYRKWLCQLLSFKNLQSTLLLMLLM